MQWAKGAIDELELNFKRIPADSASIELLNWRKEMPSNETKFNKISDSYKECLQTSTTNALIKATIKQLAYTMVKNLESIDEIWKRLEQAFGDTRMMLRKKINQLKSLEISKKNPEKLVSGISNLISMMQEMAALAKKHDIEEHLYYGDTLTHIQNLLGDGRTTRFLSETYEDDFTPRETW
eukprot:TCONS_00033281-protein